MIQSKHKTQTIETEKLGSNTNLFQQKTTTIHWLDWNSSNTDVAYDRTNWYFDYFVIWLLYCRFHLDKKSL